MDYLSDISQWRSYCAIEDTFVQGRFSLRGSELGLEVVIVNIFKNFKFVLEYI